MSCDAAAWDGASSLRLSCPANKTKNKGEDVDGAARVPRALRGRRDCSRGRPAGGSAGAIDRGILPRQAAQHGHRLSDRWLERHLCPRGRAPHRQAHPRQSDGDPAQHAGRWQPRRGEPRLQHRAQGRHHAVADRADNSAGRAAGRAERQAQDRRVQLDRPRGAVGQHDLRDGERAGEDHPGHVQARDAARRQRALVDGRDLSGGAAPM